MNKKDLMSNKKIQGLKKHFDEQIYYDDSDTFEMQQELNKQNFEANF